MSDILKHYGTPRRSGRYPWGSGNNSQQSGKDFLGYVDALRKEGVAESDIAKGFGMSIIELRNMKSIYKDQKRAEDAAFATRLKEKGYSNVAIGSRMGLNESSVRSLLNPLLQERANVTQSVANVLKEAVAKHKYIDVGVGVENHLGISQVKLRTAVALLKEQGYKVFHLREPQVGTDHKTSYTVLVPPEVEFKELYKNRAQVKMIGDRYSKDGGLTFDESPPPRHLSSDRVEVVYDEDGGSAKDGVIELRRGVEDISLGNARYAQVRIGVDGTHYLKGMAMYSDDLPEGVDIRFNTSKARSEDKLDALKPIKADSDYPFGAVTRPKVYKDASGKEQVSSLNIVNEEGDWQDWSNNISSQMLSKQAPSLAKRQLDLAFDSKMQEFNEVQSLTNPSVRKRLLEALADDADSSSVHLKAAGLPRQAWSVILPVPGMKETEVYAPKHRDGESVVLVRYPHGGIFEIPELRVNNKNRDAKRLFANAEDAIGIHPKVAERISGADFDGDTVLIIPNNEGRIRTSSALEGLKNFNPRTSYPEYPGMPRMKSATKQRLMGDVSNLITDMTIKGANQDEICRAVRHSMVVIDAEKHNLNYKLSHQQNGIAELKQKYQGRSNAGASTLISKAKSEKRVDYRKDVIKVDPKTGEKIYEETGEVYTTASGKTLKRTSKSTKMQETDDALTLSSGTVMEKVYGTYANKLKALANKARKTALETVPIPYSPSARQTYSKEVSSLNAKLNLALKNKPHERQAQLLANAAISAKRRANPDMSAADIKKIKGQELVKARIRAGAKKDPIVITDREWEAIQAGAITKSALDKVLLNADLDRVKELATPRTARPVVSGARKLRARTMLASGYTQAEVADAIGVSINTLMAAFD